MCEIVKNWVGSMDNTFYYCRSHKIESASEKECVFESIRNTTLEPRPIEANSTCWHVWGVRSGVVTCAYCGVPANSLTDMNSK